jgi:hypothetical protein
MLRHNGTMMGTVGFVLVACLGLPVFAQGNNLLVDDDALLHFAMHDDWKLPELKPCENLTLLRSKYRGLPGFRIQGQCARKNLAEGDSECPSYAIEADGTVEGPKHATIRKIALTLKCGGQ